MLAIHCPLNAVSNYRLEKLQSSGHINRSLPNSNPLAKSNFVKLIIADAQDSPMPISFRQPAR
ncbi:hypothetical protein AB833_04555 [Chromatiales bacterium (ex Bugula neritina AB1)]|nr:hypothetical protein AB833_04555 [Chromatiales bacterium (ex Bugula neritina AB1)]